jgi:hypothetical protein
VNVSNKDEDVIFPRRDEFSRFRQTSVSIITSHKTVILKSTDASGTDVASRYRLPCEDSGAGRIDTLRMGHRAK